MLKSSMLKSSIYLMSDYPSADLWKESGPLRRPGSFHIPAIA